MPNNTDANSQYNRDDIERLLPVTRQNGMDIEQHDSSLSGLRRRVTRTAEAASRTARTQINRLHHSFFHPPAAQTTQVTRQNALPIDGEASSPPNTVRQTSQRPISELRRVTRQHPLPLDENDAVSSPQRRNNQ